ncbi:MAG: ribonuclease P protein component [Burkholderiaceae bacterium]
MKPAASPAGARARRSNSAHLALLARLDAGGKAPRLMMAVPKKLVPSSPVRNLVRRVLREAHRSALMTHAPLADWSLRLQLVKLPTNPELPETDAKGQGIRPFRRRPTDGLLKRRLRVEADELLRRAPWGRAMAERGPTEVATASGRPA